MIQGPGLWVLDETGPHLEKGNPPRPIGTTPVQADKGFLADLLNGMPNEWVILRAIAFPHEAPE